MRVENEGEARVWSRSEQARGDWRRLTRLRGQTQRCLARRAGKGGPLGPFTPAHPAGRLGKTSLCGEVASIRASGWHCHVWRSAGARGGCGVGNPRGRHPFQSSHSAGSPGCASASHQHPASPAARLAPAQTRTDVYCLEPRPRGRRSDPRGTQRGAGGALGSRSGVLAGRGGGEGMEIGGEWVD